MMLSRIKRRDWLLSPKYIPYLLVAITFLGSVVWLYNLGANSYWSDELLSILHAQKLADISALLTLQVGNAHPPFYFLLLRPWLIIGGDGETWTRLLSVLMALPTIPCIYLLGKRLVSRSAGIIGSFLYAVMPLMLIYNREVRMYPLFVTLSCVSLLLLLTAIKKDRIVHWALYSLVTFITLITHYHGFLVLAAQGMFLLSYSVRTRSSWRLIVRFTLASSVALLMFLPFLPAFLAAIGTTGEMWRSGASSFLVSRGYLAFSLVLGQTIMPWDPFAIMGGIAVMVLGIAGLWHNRANRDLILILASYGVIVFIIGPLVSLDMPRYYLFFVPLVCIGLASGVTKIRPYYLSIACTLLLLLSWTTSDINYYMDKDFHIMATVDPWREVAGFLQKNVDRNDKILAEFGQPTSSYYISRYGLQDQSIKDLSQFDRVDGNLPTTVWLVVGNPVYTHLGAILSTTLISQYGYTLVATTHFLYDPNYLEKGRFFRKDFAEYRVEVFQFRR